MPVWKGSEAYSDPHEAESQFLIHADRFRRYAVELLDFLGPPYLGKLLDVGTGLGWVVLEAKRRGFEAEGIDPAEVFIRTGKKFLGVNIRTGTLKNVKKKYDVVVLKHVLEHISARKNFIEDVKRVLKPGGRLLIAIPNIRSLMYWIFRDRWYGLQPKQHVYLPSPWQLRRDLESWGFVITKQLNTSLDYDPPGIKKTIFYFLTKTANLFQVGDQLICCCEYRPNVPKMRRPAGRGPGRTTGHKN
jgi:SAM-dependent methyltransferase